MRRRYIQRKDGTLVEVSRDYLPDPQGPLVIPDLPGYQSPVTGLWVEGRVQRREDMKRTGSRPWEGLDQEKKEAARQQQYVEQRNEATLDRVAHEVFYQMPPSKRDLLKRI